MDNQRNVTEVEEIKGASSLRLKFNCGLGDNGKALVKSRTYSNLKPDANALDVYNVALALESLQKNDLFDVVKQDNTSLS